MGSSLDGVAQAATTFHQWPDDTHGKTTSIRNNHPPHDAPHSETAPVSCRQEGLLPTSSNSCSSTVVLSPNKPTRRFEPAATARNKQQKQKIMDGEQAPVQVGQFILAKNLGIGAFGKVGHPGCHQDQHLACLCVERAYCLATTSY
jgi:hypothetical protein